VAGDLVHITVEQEVLAEAVVVAMGERLVVTIQVQQEEQILVAVEVAQALVQALHIRQVAAQAAPAS